MNFIATVLKTDRSPSREHTIRATDIDNAVEFAIGQCADDEFVAAVRQADIDTRPEFGAEVVLVLGNVSAITKTEKGEIVETVDWVDGKPDWTNAGICDPRGTSHEAFGDLASALEHAERNYEFVFGEKPARLPD